MKWKRKNTGFNTASDRTGVKSTIKEIYLGLPGGPKVKGYRIQYHVRKNGLQIDRKEKA